MGHDCNFSICVMGYLDKYSVFTLGYICYCTTSHYYRNEYINGYVVPYSLFLIKKEMIKPPRRCAAGVFIYSGSPYFFSPAKTKVMRCSFGSKRVILNGYDFPSSSVCLSVFSSPNSETCTNPATPS